MFWNWVWNTFTLNILTSIAEANKIEHKCPKSYMIARYQQGIRQVRSLPNQQAWVVSYRKSALFSSSFYKLEKVLSCLPRVVKGVVWTYTVLLTHAWCSKTFGHDVITMNTIKKNTNFRSVRISFAHPITDCFRRSWSVHFQQISYLLIDMGAQLPPSPTSVNTTLCYMYTNLIIKLSFLLLFEKQNYAMSCNTAMKPTLLTRTCTLWCSTASALCINGYVSNNK